MGLLDVVGGILGLEGRADEVGRGHPQLGFDPSAGQLPGAGERGGRLLNLAQQAGQRQAPQIGVSGFRAGQEQLVGQLQQLAAGQGPSAAQRSLEDALRRNVSTQQALLSSGRPGGQAAAARQASQQAGQLGGSLAGQAAQARVQEQLGAIGQLGGVLQGGRGADLQRSLGEAGLGLLSQALSDQAMLELLRQEMRNAALQQQGGLGVEQIKAGRFGGLLGTPTSDEAILGALVSGGSAALAGG